MVNASATNSATAGRMFFKVSFGFGPLHVGFRIFFFPFPTYKAKAFIDTQIYSKTGDLNGKQKYREPE
jgi:hypothetical protein